MLPVIYNRSLVWPSRSLNLLTPIHHLYKTLGFLFCSKLMTCCVCGQMVVTFGMSDIGPWSLMEASQSGDVIMRMMARNSMSEKLAEDIDSAIKRISDSAYEIALTQIRDNREAIDRIVEVLIEKETITGDEFRALLSEFVEIPVENRVLPAPAPLVVG